MQVLNLITHKKQRYEKWTAIILAATLGFACNDTYSNLLPGKWQAIEVVEENTPLGVHTEIIQFQFDNNSYYTYQGTLKYREAGTYHVQSNYLYTIDTVNQASTEKVVEIVQLTADSMLLE
ncbi:MAG: hypothetical protein HC926_00290 [Synechococcaceae cyanobacterium SM2_3_60]|nr:hypothetical protein [Synechococcaceae cyanobacterium SM2_3_60]